MRRVLGICGTLAELLCQGAVGWGAGECGPDAVRDLSFEGSDGFAYGLAVGESFLEVAASFGVGSSDLSDCGDVSHRFIELPSQRAARWIIAKAPAKPDTSRKLNRTV